MTQAIAGLLAFFFTTQAFATEIKMEVTKELEEVLPFTAVDSRGRAVADLKKAEIVLLVDGINFRGFSLLSPGDASSSPKAQAVPALAKAPPNAYYEIIFPYVWDSGQAIHLQLGTNRSGVHLTAPKSIQKSKSYQRIEDLQAEILALELLKENTWENLQWASLNLFSSAARTGAGKTEPGKAYDIRLPVEYLKDGIEFFKITFVPDNAEIIIQRQWVTPATTMLQIERESETYMLLADRKKAAALALKNIPASPASSEQPAASAKLSAEEKVKIIAAIGERQKTLSALQAEVKLIPVDVLLAPGPESTKAGVSPGLEKTAAVAPDSSAAKDAGASGPFPSLLLPDSKTTMLSKLESYRSEQTQTAKIHYCERALKYLKLNQLSKALPWLAKSFDLVPKKGVFVYALLEKLRRLDRYQREILDKSSSLAKVDLREKLKKIQPLPGREMGKAESDDFFSGLQKILEKNQEGFDFVCQTLAELPEYMEIADLRSLAGNITLGTLSPDPTVAELRKQIVLLRSLSAELADKTFIQASWTTGVMDNLDQILERYLRQSGVNEQSLLSFPETMAPATIGFVMANNRAFSKPFKRAFLEKRLRSLSIADEWLKDPSFFEVVIQSRAIEKNSQGFWEAVFAEDLSMIYIPRGPFTMGVPWESGGAEDESPQHEVELAAFWIAKNETTFSQYDLFCEETGRSLMSDYDKGRKKRPVIGISYQNAMDYCQWLSRKTGVHFSLPTEAEWEKAARGSDKRKYPWGNSDPDGSLGNFADLNFLKYFQQANPPADETERQQMLKWIAETTDDGQIFTAPVGDYPRGASPYGAMDMAGNVWEWVADWYDGNYYQKSPQQNPPGSSSGIYRVVRGGGWDCNPWMLRCTGRSGAPPSPNKGSETIGFRTVASPWATAQPAETEIPGGAK